MLRGPHRASVKDRATGVVYYPVRDIYTSRPSLLDVRLTCKAMFVLAGLGWGGCSRKSMRDGLLGSRPLLRLHVPIHRTPGNSQELADVSHGVLLTVVELEE